jgi:hypothetical protein
MSNASNQSPSGIPLDYGHENPHWERAWSRFRAHFHEHFDKAAESIGYVWALAASLVGGNKQLMLALGTAFLAGGLGIAIEREFSGWGPFWMWIGGLLIGLVIPAPKRYEQK